jgi:hypothetical protein
VDEFRPIPFPLIPAWIRRCFFGRSTYGLIHGIEEINLDPFSTLSELIDNPGVAIRPTTNDLVEVERRLVNDVGPGVFEHLCVSLLQLEHPDQVWAQVGGSGDGGLDGIGADASGNVIGLLQCKWRYWGEPTDFMSAWNRSDREYRRVLASLIHPSELSAVSGLEFWGRGHVARLVVKHASRLPLARSLRVAD